MSFGGGTNRVNINATTFTIAPTTVGDFFIATVVSESSTVYASGITSSNINSGSAWTVLVAHTTATPSGQSTYYVTTFIGKVTSTSSATATISFSGTAPTIRGHAVEFSTTAGYSAVTLDTSGIFAANSLTSPSLTPSHGSGELYVVTGVVGGSMTAGSTSGYTYYVDTTNDNGTAYNTNCTSSAQAPVWGGTAQVTYGGAVLLYEASTTVSLLAASVSQPGLGGLVPSTVTGGTANYSFFSQATETGLSEGSTTGGTIGLHFTANSACTLEGLWLYSPSGLGLTVFPSSIGIYNYSTEALVASNTSPTWLTGPGGSAATVGGGWAYAAFSSPVTLTASTGYMVGAFRTSGGFFAYNPLSWGSAITSGPVTAPISDGGQGWYSTTTTAISWPGANQLADSNWYLDVQVQATTEGQLQTLIDPFTSSGTLSATYTSGTGPTEVTGNLWYIEPDSGTSNQSGTVTMNTSSGILSLSGGTYSDSGYYTSVNSWSPWNLVNSAAFVKVVPGESGTGDGDTGLSVLATNFSDGYNFNITGGNLTVQTTVSDSPTTVHTVTYNSTSHAWLRIRESNGTLYFETAPDGKTWTTQYTTTTETEGTWSAGTTYIQLFYGSNSGSSSPTGTAQFQGFNVAVAAVAGTTLNLATLTTTAYSPTVVVSPSLSLASQTVKGKTLAIPSTTSLQAASLTQMAYTLTSTSNHALLAASQSASAHALTPNVSPSLLLASSTETAYTLTTHPGVGLQTASQSVAAHSPTIARTVSLLAAAVTQTAYSPGILIAAGSNLQTASQSANAHTLTPVYSGGSALLAAGQAQSAKTVTIPSTITLLSSSQAVTAYTLTTSERNTLLAASQTVTAYPFTIARTVSLLAAGLAESAKNLTTIARIGIPTTTNTVTAYSPSIVTPPSTTVNLQTAIAARISANPIGFVPPTFVNLLPAFVNRGAVRIGPPNLPVMTMTYASGYDNFGNYIPKGFNLYGTQADQLTMSQDLYYIPQPVHGVTTNVFLPTVSFQMSQEYTTKTYNPSIMFATPNNIGFSYENTYTSINSGSVDASGGAAQSVAGINLSSEPYDGSDSAYVSFQAGNGENVAVNSDGFHVTSGTRVALTAYQQSSNTTTQPGMLAEINNQGTSNEYTSAYFSSGATSGHAETYVYMGSASPSGSATNVIQFVMGGSVEAQISSGSMTVYGNFSANNFSGSYAGGQSVSGFPIATGAGIGTANLTTGNVTIAGGLASALNSIYNALVNSGLA